MLFEITIFIFYTLFCLLSVLGYGVIFSKILYNSSEKNLGELGLFGFLILYFISLFFHFFIPLAYLLNFLILSLGFIVSIIKYKFIINQIAKVKTNFVILSLIILPSILIYKTHGDFDWYHLPYVNYLNNFKIIFGLVNVQNNYAHGHGWMDIMGMFSLPIVETKGVSIIALIFFYYFILYLVFEIKNTKLKSIKIYSIILIIFCFATYNKLFDFGAEIQPALIIFVLILNVLKLLSENNKIEILNKIILYFFYAIVLRIGSVIILPFVLIVVLLNFNNVLKSIINNLRLHIFLFLFFIFFLTKSIILSGCLSYPLYKTCFDNDKIPWASPIENAREHFEFLTAISHRWHFYIREEANLETRGQYLEPMNEGIILDPRSYNENKLFWLKYWSRDHDNIRLLNSILIILFCFICFYIFSKNKIKLFSPIIFKPIQNNLIHLGLFFSILMWFFISPVMRYGGYPVIGGTLIFYSSLILSQHTIHDKKFNSVAVFLLLISTSYFVTKNITRVASVISENKFINFPWPEHKNKTLGIDYKEIIINDVKFNLILTSENMVDGKNMGPVMCGDVDMLCMPNERIVCISDIKTNNGYIFIKNDKPECLEQIRSNYWQ